jgi:hypothetical protein
VLYEDRPPAAQLTTFYLLLSVGGAVGGLFVSLVAPMTFSDVYEYPLLLALVPFLRPASRWSPEGGLARALLLVAELACAGVLAYALAGAATGDPELEAKFVSDWWLLATLVLPIVLILRRAGIAVLLTVLLGLLTFTASEQPLYQDRNFFGTTRVIGEDGMRRMQHGTTLHGAQLLAPDSRRVATTYYTEEGPFGDIVEQLQEDEPFVEVGVVGLGTGATLGHARLWQRFTYYEIDPAVIKAAEDPDLFTWISGSDVDVRVVEGDARKQLEDEERRYDLLVMDAYSSDAVPTHLLTVEAMELYLDRLAKDGVLALHISSRHLELEPVVSANVERLGLEARIRSDRPTEQRKRETGATGSRWIVVAKELDQLESLATDEDWLELSEPDPDRAWTDDFSNVAQTIRWLPGWLS